jgi:toxin ParE1/3/4
VKPLILHREAQEELDEAMAFYESRRIGLGTAFLAAIEGASMRLQRNPRQHACYKNTEYRKCVVPGFPYVVYYLELAQAIWIGAIAHTSRRPDYWAERQIEE